MNHGVRHSRGSSQTIEVFEITPVNLCAGAAELYGLTSQLRRCSAEC